MANTKKRSSTKNVILFAIVVIILIITGLYIYHLNKKSPNLAANNGQTKVQGTPSKPTPHQVTNTTPPSNPGGVTDLNGQTSGSIPPASQWVSSTSGQITLQTPTPNASLSSDSPIFGLAKVSTVQFILTDDRIGLIDQGNLSVVNGKFSGTLHFTAHSSSGKLKVYYPNPANGAEQDIIEINVNFNA